MNNRAFAKRTMAVLATIGLMLSVTATVLADAANPSGTINVQVRGLTVTLDGTWTWTRNCDSGTIHPGDRDVGWAVDWDDPSTAGNEVIPGVEVGTPTDNVVHLRAAADQGDCSGGTSTSSGPWGPISHTFAEPGEYDICAVMYDLKMPPEASGRRSLIAGGDNHNTDNSVEENSFVNEGFCAPATIVIPIQSAEGSVAAGTGQPDTAFSQSGVTPIPTIVFSLILLASLGTLAYANVKTVRNRS